MTAVSRFLRARALSQALHPCYLERSRGTSPLLLAGELPNDSRQPQTPECVAQALAGGGERCVGEVPRLALGMTRMIGFWSQPGLAESVRLERSNRPSVSPTGVAEFAKNLASSLQFPAQTSKFWRIRRRLNRSVSVLVRFSQDSRSFLARFHSHLSSRPKRLDVSAGLGWSTWEGSASAVNAQMRGARLGSWKLNQRLRDPSAAARDDKNGEC